MNTRHTSWSLFLVLAMLITAGLPAIRTASTSSAHANASPPEPLPFECGGVTPPTPPACCAYGYVYYDTPVNGASVQIESAHGSLDAITTSGPLSSFAYYTADLSNAPLSVSAGETITITASYSGMVSARTWTVQTGGQHVDLGLILGTTVRVSVASDGTQGNSWSQLQSFSADGRYVVFGSDASNLVSGDTNGCTDTFVYDRQTGQTIRVSVASDGMQGNGHSDRPSISADGRYVAFVSNTSNLVSGDTNGNWDVFVHDRQTGQTTRVSVASDGTQSNSGSSYPSISADGRYAAFISYASNLVSGDTNGNWDVFVHDGQTGQTARVSVASDGTQGNGDSLFPSISADGRYVAFHSEASNLVSSDTNGYRDVFVHDRQSGQTTRVSVASDGTQGNNVSGYPSISADGGSVAFQSDANNLVSGDTNLCRDIFVHDRPSGQTTRVSVASEGMQGNSSSGLWEGPSISVDGRTVAFDSAASNLVGGDTNSCDDVFVHDRQTGQTARVSVASDGMQGNGDAWDPSISADGRYVVFLSYANNLVSSDTNGEGDVFVHDRGMPPTAAFTATPLSGAAPLTVTFTDQSTGDVTAWDWTFGDGGVSGARYPAHVYGTAGTYTVSLTVAGPGGSDTETKPNYITVNSGPGIPIASISFIWWDEPPFPNPPVRGQDTVYFNGSGYDTDEGGAYITAYDWTSSIDGLLSNQEDFTVPAAQLSVGTHTISFRCQDDEGMWSLPVTRTLTVQAAQADVRTLILVNRQKMAALYSSSEADQVLTKLNALAAHASVKGLVVQVESDPAVAAAYAAWDADPANTTKSNAVTAAIRNLVLAQWAAHPDLEYLVLVGDDRVIPFRRVLDQTRYPESNYTLVSPSSTTGAALRANMTLTDDYYSDRVPTVPGGAGWDGHDLYIPDLGAGRLIETPAEIIAQIDTFLAGDGVTASGAVVTGYDFVKDGAQAMCGALTGDGLTTDCTLIGESWNASQFKSLVLNTRHDVVSVNGHASHYVMGTPSGNVTSSDVAGATADHTRTIFYTVGCHSGLNVPPDNPYTPLDLAQALAGRKANYVANTGYGWGYVTSVGLSEQLMLDFSERLVYGQSATLGQALAAAKQEYYLNKSGFNYYDEKILIESTLYGLPMYRFTTPTTMLKESWKGQGATAIKTEQATDLGNGLTVNSLSYQFPALLAESTGDGAYYTFGGLAHASDSEPIQPKYVADLSFPQTKAHGVVFRGGAYTDTASFNPVVDRAVTETLALAEPAFTAPGWYPALLPRLNRQERGDKLVTLLGQFHPGSQTERLYDRLSFDVYYHTSSSDWTAPTITSMSSSLGAGTAAITVGAGDPAGIHTVVIAYTANDGVWASVSLTWNGGAWTGSFPASASTEFFVQAVDQAGNVAVDDNHGGYYQPGDSLQYRLFLPLVLRQSP